MALRITKDLEFWMLGASAFALLFGLSGPAQAQDVCEGVTCDNLPSAICDAGGFSVTQTGYTPAPPSNAGAATYTYEICSPPAGTCSLDGSRSCLSNNDCAMHSAGDCSRECAVDTFRGLSHFDVFFPELGGIDSCLSGSAVVTGSCACTGDSSMGCAVDGSVVLGDASCGASNTEVAKCDNTTLPVGDCIEMTLSVPGENVDLGLGTAAVLSKESTDCNESCIAGPSCDRCDSPPDGGACLTRTLGFWGTHPWITNDYTQVTVCGYELGCHGAADGLSDPSCEAFTCNSVMEGLGSTPGIESPQNQPYVAMIKQLTAAKLNLSATAGLFGGAACVDWTYQGQSIGEWIAFCESLCGEDRRTISGSGCIEALDAFNNSEDTGFDVTPSPFDRPPVDDFGNISGADSTSFTAAHGSGNKLVIGKKTKDNDCR